MARCLPKRLAGVRSDALGLGLAPSGFPLLGSANTRHRLVRARWADSEFRLLNQFFDVRLLGFELLDEFADAVAVLLGHSGMMAGIKDGVRRLIPGNFHELRAVASKRGIAGHADVFGGRWGFRSRQDRTWHDGAAAVWTVLIPTQHA